jgi:type I restriction enzyme S subunit
MKLEKVLTFQKGKSPQKDFVSDNLILYLTPEYLRGNGEANFTPDFPSKVEVEDGDLLLLWDGSNAGEFFKGKNGFLSSTMVKFRFNEEEYEREFLFYQLKAFEGYLKSQTNGSGIPHVDRELLLGIEVEKFEKPEQIRIAQILSKADAAIARTEALIAKYQRIETGLMQDLLTRGIDGHGNIRSKATHRFVIKKGIEVPEEWEVVSLSYFIERLDSGVSVNSEDKPAGADQLGVLKTSALSGCVFNPLQNKIVEVNEISRLKCPVKKGAIIISRMNTPELVGENALVENEHDNLFLPDRLWQTVFKNEDQLSVYWLSKILSSKKYRTRISFNASGTSGTMKNITKGDFMSILIPKPSKEEQEKISQTLQAISKKEYHNAITLNKLRSLKTGLMQDLLSGKVRV